MSNNFKKTIETKLKKLISYYELLQIWQEEAETAYEEHNGNWEQEILLASAVENKLERSAQIVLDVSTKIVASKRWFAGEEEENPIEILGKRGVLPKYFSQKIAPLRNFRNILVHEYQKLNYEKLYNTLKQIDDFKEFTKHILQYLERA